VPPRHIHLLVTCSRRLLALVEVTVDAATVREKAHHAGTHLRAAGSTAPLRDLGHAVPQQACVGLTGQLQTRFA
jgi:hypothetical protein